MVGSEDDAALATVLDLVDAHSAAREKLQHALSDGYLALAREQISDYSSHLRLSRYLYDGREEVKASVVVQIDPDGSLRLVIGNLKQPATGAQTTEPLASSAIAGDGLRRRPRAGKSSSNLDPQENAPSKDTTSRTVHAGDLGGQTRPVQEQKCELRHTFHAMPTSALREACRCFENAVRAAVDTVNAAAVADSELERFDVNADLADTFSAAAVPDSELERLHVNADTGANHPGRTNGQRHPR